MKKVQQYQQLQLGERIALSQWREQGLSLRAMARMLGRSPSTISREITRNAPSGQYRCTFAQQRRNRRRVHCRAQPKLHITGMLFAQICQFEENIDCQRISITCSMPNAWYKKKGEGQLPFSFFSVVELPFSFFSIVESLFLVIYRTGL